jgi:MSHA pilin protein MshD
MSMRARQQGVTLVELVVAITIVAIAATSVLGALAAVASRSADAMLQQQAIAVGQAYIDEIMQRWVVDPNGSPPDTGRASWDTVDQYNGLHDVGARDQFNNPIAALAGYTVDVAVVASAGLGGLAASDVRRIDVTVRHAPGVTVALTAYRTAY